MMALFGSLVGFGSTACVKLPHGPSPATGQATQRFLKDESRAATPTININTASAEELERLPGIGRALAARIISFREQYGPFRRAEHLMMVRGIGDRRFRRLQSSIKAE